jgi:hypothetical protein
MVDEEVEPSDQTLSLFSCELVQFLGIVWVLQRCIQLSTKPAAFLVRNTTFLGQFVDLLLIESDARQKSPRSVVLSHVKLVKSEGISAITAGA